MYPPILNCGYRNDKIVFDWIEYEPSIEDERRWTRNQRQRGENAFLRQESASI